MRLALFNWPPVASHLTCIIAGLAIAHLTQKEESPRGPIFPERNLILPIMKKDLKKYLQGDTVAVGVNFFVLTGSRENPCLLHAKPLKVIGAEDQILFSLPVEEIEKIQPFILALNAKEPKTWPLGQADLLPRKFYLESEKKLPTSTLCGDAPKVIYD